MSAEQSMGLVAVGLTLTLAAGLLSISRATALLLGAAEGCPRKNVMQYVPMQSLQGRAEGVELQHQDGIPAAGRARLTLLNPRFLG